MSRHFSERDSDGMHPDWKPTPAATQAAPSVAAPAGMVLAGELRYCYGYDVLWRKEFIDAHPPGDEPWSVKLYAALPLPAVVQADLTQLDALAKVYASSYASPHHITFTVEGLRNLIASMEHSAAPGSPSAQVRPLVQGRGEPGQGELPVRAEMEKVLDALDAIADDFNPDRPSDAYLALEEMRDAIRALRAAMSAPGGGGAANG